MGKWKKKFSDARNFMKLKQPSWTWIVIRSPFANFSLFVSIINSRWPPPQDKVIGPLSWVTLSFTTLREDNRSRWNLIWYYNMSSWYEDYNWRGKFREVKAIAICGQKFKFFGKKKSFFLCMPCTDNYFSVQDSAERLKSTPTKKIAPIGLLYIGQREFGATTPEDGKFIWSYLRQILKRSFPLK